MSVIDWIVFFLFLAYVVWDGSRRGIGTEDLEGYFAGSRAIPWWAAGLSVMATQASAITVIGTTGQGHETGMEFVQTYFGLPFAMILLCIFMVPLLRKNPILTAYEYLEGQFGPATRTLASAIFLVSRCLAFGVVIYAPAVVLSAMTGFSLFWMVIVIGLVTTVYTVLGGINAVVWTDVKQMSVIFGGLFVCVAILLDDLLPHMSFGDMLRVMGASGKLNALELQPASWDLTPALKWDAAAPGTFWEDTYNVWSGFFGGIFLMLSYFGCDQSQVQRILTNPSADESRKTLLLSAFAKVPMQILILFLGALLYLYGTVIGTPMLYNPDQRALAAQPAHAGQIEPLQASYDKLAGERRRLALEIAQLDEDPRSHPDLLKEYQNTVRQVAEVREQARSLLVDDPSENRDTNYVFPHFILNNLPPVILGLLVAAIFAAAMSSADSALNALSSATIVDFYQRWLRPDAGQAASLRASRVATLFWGTAATVAALQFAGAGSVIELVNKVGSYFYGSLLGVFVLSMVSRRAGPYAGVASLLGGMATVFVIDQTLQVAFLWYNLFGFLGSLAVGLAAAPFDKQ